MAKLYIKDENGNFVEIPAFKGNDGKSAYEQAKEGGYTGTEEEFIALLNALTAPSDSICVNEQGGFYAGLSALTNYGGGAIGNDAFATTGGAVGAIANAIAGGGSVGNNAYTSSGGSVGNNARSASGGSVGDNAYSNHGGGAVGKDAYATNSGGAVGESARAENGGGAVGDGAYTTSGCAVGSHAISKEGVAVGSGASTSPDGTIEAAVDAIQLGTGVNTSAKTLQVYDYQLLDADGIIPSDRLPSGGVSIASGYYVGTGTGGSGNPNSLTFPFVPKVVFVATESTIASGSSDAKYFATAVFVHGSILGFVSNSTPSAERTYDVPIALTWSDKTLSWYYLKYGDSTVTGMTPSYQLNYSGMTYRWVAIG